MSKLTELLIQNNFLTTLPIELTQTDLANPKNVFRADGENIKRNIWGCNWRGIDFKMELNAFNKINSIHYMDEEARIKELLKFNILDESFQINEYISFIDKNYFFFGIIFILIFYNHRDNIKRLKNREETKTKIY